LQVDPATYAIALLHSESVAYLHTVFRYVGLLHWVVIFAETLDTSTRAVSVLARIAVDVPSSTCDHVSIVAHAGAAMAMVSTAMTHIKPAVAYVVSWVKNRSSTESLQRSVKAVTVVVVLTALSGGWVASLAV
jgi:hypothetical protein